MEAIEPNGNQRTAHLRIKRAIAQAQFELASERLDRFTKLPRRPSRKRDGIDPDRLRAALLERLDFWWKRREFAGGIERAHSIEEVEQVHGSSPWPGVSDGTSKL